MICIYWLGVLVALLVLLYLHLEENSYITVGDIITLSFFSLSSWIAIIILITICIIYAITVLIEKIDIHKLLNIKIYDRRNTSKVSTDS